MNQPAPNPYVYPAKVQRVIDGDTIVVALDLGLHTWRWDLHLRFRGVNAPELHGPNHDAATRSMDYVGRRVHNATTVLIQTHKDQTGKYGRLLADVWVDGDLLNQELLDKGLAVPFEGPVEP